MFTTIAYPWPFTSNIAHVANYQLTYDKCTTVNDTCTKWFKWEINEVAGYGTILIMFNVKSNEILLELSQLSDAKVTDCMHTARFKV